MAIGDESVAAGYGFVPDTGSQDALVKWGAREINRTRDFLAQVKNSVLSVCPVSRGGTGGNTKTTARTGLGIASGSAFPTGGEDGDIYFRVL